jgi:hypothetical protein
MSPERRSRVFCPKPTKSRVPRNQKRVTKETRCHDMGPHVRCSLWRGDGMGLGERNRARRWRLSTRVVLGWRLWHNSRSVSDIRKLATPCKAASLHLGRSSRVKALTRRGADSFLWFPLFRHQVSKSRRMMNHCPRLYDTALPVRFLCGLSVRSSLR